ncbi:MAG: hypothetical protein WHV63_06900 [Ignavibacteria bacterium]|nr:hypothetical protein [Ignavibacteria bacterium]
MRLYFQNIIIDIHFEILPSGRHGFAFNWFSNHKNLLDFPKQALKNIFKDLQLYFKENTSSFGDITLQEGKGTPLTPLREGNDTPLAPLQEGNRTPLTPLREGNYVVEFEDGTKINIKDLDYKLIKPLIWWE